jgi:hypothetical protein
MYFDISRAEHGAVELGFPAAGRGEATRLGDMTPGEVQPPAPRCQDCPAQVPVAAAQAGRSDTRLVSDSKPNRQQRLSAAM